MNNIMDSITKIFSKMFNENIKNFCINLINWSTYEVFINFITSDTVCYLINDNGICYAKIKNSGINSYSLDINSDTIADYQFIKTIDLFVAHYIKEQDFKLTNNYELQFDSITELLLYYSDCYPSFTENGDNYYIDNVKLDTILQDTLNINISATDIQY